MKKIKLISNSFLYYVIGLISFSTIAFITQRITISLLLDSPIDVRQDIYNIVNYIKAYSLYYLIAYTVLHFLIICAVRKYDKYTVNKLNDKLKQFKVGGEENGER